jgi:hypothetical protein
MRRGRLCCLALLLALAGSTSAAADDWQQVHVQVLTIHYRTHDGNRRAAYVVLPDWYGPRDDPPLPLVISPHGRGVTASANVDRWGDLPASGGFAVVNPDGQGRRFGGFSWGYEGQIDDLARMPEIVQRAIPWLRVDRSRIYAFGASMGGQESLLLVAQHPRLLAGAAVFDAVTDMAARYRDFGRLDCNRRCLARWRAPLGSGLRALARTEIGGTPRSNPRAYAARSPLAHARALAASGVPLQFWWSRADRVVLARDQSVPLVRALRRLHANVYTDVGNWPHAADMHPYYMLIPALRRSGLLPERSTAAARAAGPVHPLLPWHAAKRDAQRKLLAWYRPEAGLGYDHVLRLGWNFVEHRARKLYLRYAVFDGRSLRGIYWQHHPAFLNAAFVDSLLGWYPYSGDRRAITTVREMLDFQLAHGTTPRGWAWPRVPFATSCAGDSRYGRCLAGLPRWFYGGIEPDKVGLLGRGYLLFYELTGGKRYLQAATAAGDALARHVRTGDEAHTPWPFRVDARTGKVLNGAQFGGLVVGPIALLDELITVGAGNTASYLRARDIAWTWLRQYQLNPASAAWNAWSGFYEDVPFNLASRNQASPTLTALYLLDNPGRDPDWKQDVSSLLQYVRTSFGRGPFAGAWAIDEQRAPGRPGCCSPVGLGSTTSRWAAANARLAAQTGDGDARELAIRSLNYATYFAASNGLISCCGKRAHNTYWFSDGYADYLRSFNWAMAALPDLAPKGQNHLLGSSSVVQQVAYGPRTVTYRTFDRNSTEVLRLNFRPAGAVGADGWDVEPLDGGDFVVRIRHSSARQIRIEG